MDLLACKTLKNRPHNASKFNCTQWSFTIHGEENHERTFKLVLYPDTYETSLRPIISKYGKIFLPRTRSNHEVNRLIRKVQLLTVHIFYGDTKIVHYRDRWFCENEIIKTNQRVPKDSITL